MMPEKDFIRLLERYRAGQCSDEEIKLIDQWYDQLDGKSRLSMSESERLDLKKKLWHQIDAEVDADEEDSQTGKQIQLPIYRRWVAAAAVAMLIGIGTFITYRYQSATLATGGNTNVVNSEIAEYSNKTDKAEQITLKDGSIVQLQPNSSIRYSTNLNSPKRETWLTGKAFFDVQRNPNRPFLVYSGNVATRVLGTSFWVTAPTNAQTVEVAVQTGKVAVFKNVTHSNNVDKKTNDEADAVITPNEKVTIFVEQNRLARGLVDEPKPLESLNPTKPVSFDFEASALPEVLSRLEQTYGIKMVIGNQALTECRFTGNISKQPLYSKLELLCQAINAHYEIQGPRIIINGAGCTP
ncbi:hypothetical protein GCM10028807_01020 [Spirosoma daeguense]